MFKKPYIIDCHCDTILRVVGNKGTIYINPHTHIDFKSLNENSVIIQFFAAWPDSKLYRGRVFQRTASLIDKIYTEVENHKDIVSIITNYNQIQENINSNKTSILISVEGGDAIEGDLSLLRTLHRLGVRSLTLTWNGRNEIADGVGIREAGGGLTPFGKSVINECNSLGIIIDVSHISEPGFWDVINLTKAPIIASHSNAIGICNHPRNLTNEQIKAIATNKGVIGINFASEFLGSNEKGIEYIFRHIEYIADLIGINYIAMGSDFDGITAPKDITGPSCYSKIIEKLYKANYSDDDINKIMGENILRIIKEVIK